MIYRFMNADTEAVRNVQIVHDDGRLESFDEGSERWAKMIADGIVPDAWADPRTPQEIYDETVLAPLDAAVLKDAARMVEDFYDALEGSLPQSMKDERGPLMAERKAKRAKRP